MLCCPFLSLCSLPWNLTLILLRYTSFSILERRKYCFIFSLISTPCFENIDCSTFSLKAGQALSSWVLFWVMVSDYSCCSLLNFPEEIRIFFLGDSSKLGKMLQWRLFQFWTARGIISHIFWAILTGWCGYFLKLLTLSTVYIILRLSF